MIKLTYKKQIKAPAEKVYKTMLGLDDIKTYEEWTASFNPTSTYEGNWEKGSKMYFLGFDKDGKRGGMISEIAENTPNQFVSIRHYGYLDGDNEITEGAEVEKWAGCLENYSLHEENGETTVTIETETLEGYEDSLNSTWPKALDKLNEVVLK